MNKEELTISVPWGIISGVVWGSRSDAPVLMVHGLQDNAGSFDNLIPLLPQQGFCYISIDLPGHGRSSHYPFHMSYTVISYVEIISFVVIEYLKLDRFVYIGHSMGGHIGYIFTGVFPDKVVKLVTIDTVLHRVIPTALIPKWTRERIDDLIKFEQRLKDKIAPKYSYSEAVNRVCQARVIPIPESGAEVLVKRALIENDGKFSFTIDPRLKLNVFCDFNIDQYSSFIDNIQCPVVLILANSTTESYRHEIKHNHKILKDRKNFKHFIVDGSHDVHLIDSSKVSSIISSCLLGDPKSKL